MLLGVGECCYAWRLLEIIGGMLMSFLKGCWMLLTVDDCCWRLVKVVGMLKVVEDC